MGVEVSRLSNGLTVATETLPSLESVALGAWVKSGARNERDEEHGMAHLLEHMAFKGTARRSAFEIASEIENVGGEINAATSVETTSYYARVLSDDVPLAVDILADILQESEFDPEELEREQHVILQEIGAAHDTPDDIVFDRFTETAFRHQTIGRSLPLGLLRHLYFRRARRDRAKRYRQAGAGHRRRIAEGRRKHPAGRARPGAGAISRRPDHVSRKPCQSRFADRKATAPVRPADRQGGVDGTAGGAERRAADRPLFAAVLDQADADGGRPRRQAVALRGDPRLA